MTSGSCERLSELPDAALGLIEESRRAILATVDLKTRPHAVPVCFAVRGNEIVSAIDDKPKGRRRLARVVNLEANPSATILFDRWAEDWTRLGWVMVTGRARLEPPGSADEQLAARYPQYAQRRPSGEVIVLAPERLVWWTYA